MRKARRMLLVVSTAFLMVGGAGAVTPALACNGDPCDGFCLTYAQLPKKPFGPECPIR